MSVLYVDTNMGRFFGWHLKEIKASYEDAVERGATEFTFQDQPMVVGYAKYLIQFLEGEGLQPCDPPSEEGISTVTGRPIAELHALFAERMKTISGSIVDPNSGAIILQIDGKIVGMIDWPELMNDLLELQTASRH
jgi:hypothetical protein